MADVPNDARAESAPDASSALRSVCLSVSFVCEPGRLAAQALLLAASLRDACPGVELLACLPRAVPDATAHALASLAVATAAIRNPLAADYPIGNKVAALAAGDPAGLRVFLDSDMLCLRAPDWPRLAGVGLAAKPADVATFDSAAAWRLLYRRFGLPPPTDRIVSTVGEQLMYPYFNAGMLATTMARPLAAVWADVCRALDGMRDVNPRRPWLDQIGLPIATARLGVGVHVLDEAWNYPAHIKPLLGTPALVHYHLPGVVAREPALRTRAGALLDRYPEVAAALRADPAWVPVLHALAREGRRKRGVSPLRANASRRRARGTTPARDLIVTGIPRSGTSYLCRLLDGFDNVAVINEPAELFEGLRRSPEPWAVPVLYADLRARIERGEAVPNKLDTRGGLTEDTAQATALQAYRPRIRTADWVLATKNTLAYAARLGGLRRVFPDARIVALVRNPLDTLASWKVSFAHLAQGDSRALPVGGLADPFLPARLRSGLTALSALSDAAVRRAAWWRLLAGEILAWQEHICIVRYEDLVADPESLVRRVLGPLAVAAGTAAPALAPSTPRTAGRAQLDAADRRAIALVCADAATALGYALATCTERST